MGVYTEAFLSAFKPKPILTVSQWADENRVLTTETSSVPGKWRTDFTPYLREPMDTCASPDYQHIVFMFASQLGKSEALNCVAGYYIDQEPAPQMMVQPTLQTAKEYAQIRISPMIKASPVLSMKVIENEEKGGRKNDKDKPSMYYKPYPGGYLVLAGSNSAPSLASKPIRILLRDEIDRFPSAIPGEGSPLELSEQRTRTFYNKKIIDSSTPLIEGSSAISDMYEKSDKRNYFVPCPHCNEMQTLDFKDSVVWDKDGTDTERSKTARIICKHCGETIKGAGRADSDWLKKGEWRKTAVSDIAGFYLSALYSPLITLQEIVLKWLNAVHSRDEDMKQTFYNLMLGLPYDKSIKQYIDHEQLYQNRREYYEDTIPSDVIILTCGVDTQDTYLAAQLVGWSHGYESWVIDYRIFMGKPDDPKVWKELDEYLMKSRTRADGIELPIISTLVDSGGHFTKEVYAFTKPREPRRVFSLKGHSRENTPFISKPSKVGTINAHLFNVNTDSGKQKIIQRLSLQEHGPYYIHFPHDEESGVDSEYFKQLLSEKYVTKKVGGGYKGEWVKIYERNEVLDTYNYALAAAELISPDFEVLEKVLTQVKSEPPKRKRPRSKGIEV